LLVGTRRGGEGSFGREAARLAPSKRTPDGRHRFFAILIAGSGGFGVDRGPISVAPTSAVSADPARGHPCPMLDAALRFFPSSIFCASSRFRKPSPAPPWVPPRSPPPPLSLAASWCSGPPMSLHPLQGHGWRQGCVPGSGVDVGRVPPRYASTRTQVPRPFPLLLLHRDSEYKNRLPDLSSPLLPPRRPHARVTWGSVLSYDIVALPHRKSPWCETGDINLTTIPDPAHTLDTLPRLSSVQQPFSSGLLLLPFLFAVIPFQYSGVTLRSGSLVTRRLANQSPRGV